MGTRARARENAFRVAFGRPEPSPGDDPTSVYAAELVQAAHVPRGKASVNPARSTGPALIVGGWAISQLWLFWVAPVIGAALAGVAYRVIGGGDGARGG